MSARKEGSNTARRRTGQLSDASNVIGASRETRAKQTQQPRAQLPPPKRRDGVLVKPRFTRLEVRAKARELLKVSFDLSDVQSETIIKLDQDYDVFCVMGTSYGKSIIYETLAALNPGRVIIVICPLKALEYDQVAGAQAKGLSACALNEDTATDAYGKPSPLWKEIRTGKRQLVYVSPEMALGAHFTELLADEAFYNGILKLVLSDEAHVIKEWADNFRKAYGQLSRLRSFTGNNVPFAAFSATVTTECFSVIWNALSFGCRPFWGIDAGVMRPNLTYIIKRREKLPVQCMNSMSIIPDDLSTSSTAEQIPKSVFYLERQIDCVEATRTIRRSLPGQVRASAVRPFSSIASTEAKDQIWKAFCDGTCRVLCATDAAGMGCNVPDIEFCAIFELKGAKADAHLTTPRLSQRWGRPGRKKGSRGICVLHVPDWAFRPIPKEPLAVPALTRVVSGATKKEKLEPAQWTEWRNSLPDDLEELINLGHFTAAEKLCIHIYLARLFRPDTGLTVYHTLDMTDTPVKGFRTTRLPYPATWIVVDLEKPPESDTCCSICNPELLKLVEAVSSTDPRFTKFAPDFLRPLVSAESQNSQTPSASTDSTTRVDRPAPPSTPSSQQRSLPSTPRHLRGNKRHTVTPQQRANLESALRSWRKAYANTQGPFTTALDVLPDNVLKAVLERVDVLANCTNLQVHDVTGPSKWQMATEEEGKSVLDAVKTWVSTLRSGPVRSPPTREITASQRRPDKRTRLESPIPETPPETPSRMNRMSIASLLSPDRSPTLQVARPSASPLRAATPSRPILPLSPHSTHPRFVHPASPSGSHFAASVPDLLYAPQHPHPAPNSRYPRVTVPVQFHASPLGRGSQDVFGGRQQSVQNYPIPSPLHYPINPSAYSHSQSPHTPAASHMQHYPTPATSTNRFGVPPPQTPHSPVGQHSRHPMPHYGIYNLPHTSPSRGNVQYNNGSPLFRNW